MELTVVEVSKELDVSVDTIRRWDKKGLIKSIRSERNYRLFDIDEVRRLQKKLSSKDDGNGFKILKSKEKTKYKVIELFAGAGGTALGFENAGLQHVLLNEIDKNAALTLKSNFPKNTKIICDDVKNISFTGYKGKVDIVQAGFPCQAFSYAGKSLGFEDTRGTLFFEFARCVKEVQPKIAVGENVRGLLKHDNGKTLKTMVNVLEELGYKVCYKILRAQYLDVPQKRERLIIMAVRNDLDIPFIYPKEQDYTVSLREALKDCPKSQGQVYSKAKYEILKLVPEGGYWRDLPIELQKKYMAGSFYLSGGKTGMARRLSWDEPSLTLTCAPAQKQTERCHPSETRPLTVREYARIQTFPDDWEFKGSLSSQYKQIGNAVPVNLSYHVGKCLIKMLDGSYNNLKDMEIYTNNKETVQLKLL
ncbi:MAG: DNA (cytosine-5-)-methyltransferase [Candidatus Gastranaerophilales bacterium]|nr:DNA (cytosine-5-)-methyltransferase [Candidatus Gastranaerophilales bacterium]